MPQLTPGSRLHHRRPQHGNMTEDEKMRGSVSPPPADSRVHATSPSSSDSPPLTSSSSTNLVPLSPSKEKGPSVVEAEDVEAGTSCCHPETRAWAVIVKLGACVVAGVLFGWCLEKGRVFAPASIRLQMTFERWIMLKMFLAAVASGQLVLSIMSLLPPSRQLFLNCVDEYGGCFCDKGVLTSTIGPFILGAGMTLSGACPGMVLAQVGSWTKNAYITFIGTLIGALLYGLVAPYISKITKPKTPPFRHPTVHGKFNIPFAAVALPMAGLLTVTVVLMEVYINWKLDLDITDQIRLNTTANTNIITTIAWPPSVAGAIIGLLQVVIVLSVGDTLGGSTSYVTIVSQWVVTRRLQLTFPYLAKKRIGLGNWWQVFYVCAAILGGLFSSLSSDSLATTYGANVPTALLGGVLLLLGARLAAGCTSGHGLSGMGLLFWLSFIAVPFMFAGGIVTAFSMKATGALEDWAYH